MNILYYIPNISQKVGGIRQYSVALLKILAKDKTNKYFILHNVNDPQVVQVLEEHPHLQLIPTRISKEGFFEKFIKNVINFFNYYFLFTRRKRFKGFSFMNRLCRKYKIDIVHCPYQEAPTTTKAKILCTLHDVQELHFPEFFSPQQRLNRAYHYMDILQRADNVIVSYKHIKEDLLKYFPFLTNEKITVCLLEMQNLWFEKMNAQNLLEKSALNVPNRFLLYPANVWPHKNHLALLQAINILKEQDILINLVCTGHKRDHYQSTLEPFIKAKQLEKQIFFKGIVSEDELYSLYQNATGVVIPTLYEAGSFPLMESILMNIPVICAETTSLPETIDNQEFTFNPNDVKEISELVNKLWSDSNYREQSKKNNLTRQKHLKETNAFNIVQTIYSDLLAKA